MTSNEELIAEARSVVSWNMADEIFGQHDRLLTDLANALEAADAELANAWEHGNATGWSRAMRHMSDEPLLGRKTKNPYA